MESKKCCFGDEGNRFAFLPMAKIKVATSVCTGGSNSPPDCCIPIGSIPYAPKRRATLRVALLFGGDEGNRTPVRKQFGRTFSGRSLLFTFPHLAGNKHSARFSSFIMRGALKALRTHGLHLDHTRARLVDLPGRMGA